MREIKIPESGPKRQLLDAAERLFAARGFEAVSVRDVTREVGASVAAVNYHFGDRDQLVRLVMIRHFKPLIEEQLLRVEALEKKSSGKTAPVVEEIIEAMSRPLLTAVRKMDLPESAGCELLGRILSDRDGSYPEDLEKQMQSVIQRFMKLMGKALPSVTADELIWRMHFVTGGMIQMLLGRGRLESNEAATIDATLGRFIRFASAGLREGVEAAPTDQKGPQATFNF